MQLSEGSLISYLVAVSFAVGLNLYATVALLGLLGHLHYIDLPAGLGVLDSTSVITVTLCTFAVELVADKIPVLDVVWSAAHTFIRVPAAALSAFRASHGLPTEMQLLVAVVAAAVAGIAHGLKTAVRTAATASPEPVSNFMLRGSEDVAALGLTWLATHHPVLAASIAAAAVLPAIFAIRWVVKKLRRSAQSLRTRVQEWKLLPAK